VSLSYPSNPGANQEHISFITNILFLMILHISSSSNTNSNKILGSILYCHPLQLAIFAFVYSTQETYYFKDLIVGCLSNWTTESVKSAMHYSKNVDI